MNNDDDPPAGIPGAYAAEAHIERGAFYSDGVTEAWCADVECGQGSEHVATIYARSYSEAVFWADLVAWVIRNPAQAMAARSGETSGSTEGNSAVPIGDALKGGHDDD